MSDDINKQDPALTDKLTELETFIKRTPGHDRVSVLGDQVIPILDDLVLPDDSDEPAVKIPAGDELDHRIDDIAELVEQKLSTELDEIVNLLKGNLKDSIIHELQDQINKEPGKKSDD